MGVNNASYDPVTGLSLAQPGVCFQKSPSPPSPLFQTMPWPGCLRDVASLLTLPCLLQCPMPGSPSFPRRQVTLLVLLPLVGHKYGLKPQLYQASWAISLYGGRSPSLQVPSSGLSSLGDTWVLPCFSFTLGVFIQDYTPRQFVILTTMLLLPLNVLQHLLPLGTEPESCSRQY